MGSWGTVGVVVVAVALVAAAVLLVVRRGLPWTAILLAAITSGLCFALGGASRGSVLGPNAAVVTGAVVGVLSVVSAVLVLLPARDRSRPPPRTPLYLSAGGTVVGAVGLLMTQLAS